MQLRLTSLHVMCSSGCHCKDFPLAQWRTNGYIHRVLLPRLKTEYEDAIHVVMPVPSRPRLGSLVEAPLCRDAAPLVMRRSS